MKIVILDNLRSAHNVGSIFRISSGIGIDKIYLCGTTPTPYESGAKFARTQKKRKELIKTSLGAEDEIAWEHFPDTLSVVQNLKKENFTIVALEQTESSIDYKGLKISNENLAIILGNEVTGIFKDILEMADQITEIPMYGQKESLNVTIAYAILIYRLLDK